MQIKNYQEAKQFIESRQSYGIKPGLERMWFMLKAIDYQSKCKIIHVTGTNGKGSTTAYLEAGLLTSNNQVGTFTSPSLSGLTGHYTHNNKEMLETEFVSYLNTLLPIIKTLDQQTNYPSEFEIITMIAILYFEDKADIAIVETGMGGLEDTTNVLCPIVSVITSISIDHQAFLGNTLKEIARHKAGIIKQDVPIVIGRVSLESLQVIKETAIKKSAKLYRLDSEFNIEKIENCYQYTQEKNQINKTFKLKNKGIYQSENASLALQVFDILNNIGFKLDLNKCIHAIEQLLIANRYEIINEKPQIIIDGAHNIASFQAFLKTVNQIKESEKHLIISAFRDKPLEEMIDLAKETFEAITVTTFAHERAYPKEVLKALDLDVTCEPNWEKIVKEILENKETNVKYYFVGSVYFTNVIKQAINKKQ